ncbi:MAG: hypothetical protein RR555_03815 [Bacteroidales bacterium]
MKNNKRFYIQLALLLIISLAGLHEGMYAKGEAGVSIIRCNPKASTSFAVFVDSKSFNECKAEILAYKEVLESEGLGTYIVSAEWTNPDMVKNEITKLAAKKPQLEGMVFIGDIPVVRVRKGQHMTTAFKMNEITFPINESSVPSDRFYDCPNLKFNYIKRDCVETNWFYYNLSEEGSQYLNPAYYSARMVVPPMLVKTIGIDKYTLLRNYLVKVVNTHKENNLLDKFIYFAGHGYNSDCLTAWRQQSIAFRSYFPAAFKESAGNKFLNFRQEEYMKFTLFTEMQRLDVDIFMFYEHGSPDKQHISGDSTPEGIEENLLALKGYMRGAYQRVKPEKREAFVKDICTHFMIPDSIFTEQSMAIYAEKGKKARENGMITLDDLSKVKTGARFTMFNACYNGSFHVPGYIAGYHIFNDGKTVVTQGNTVNVLQDKWADQLIGLLSLGVRIGFWQKEVVTLESHLVGDPTFRFAAATPNTLTGDLVNKASDELYWKSLLKEKNPTIRALAIKQLQKCYLLGKLQNQKDFSKEILDIFSKDSDMTVRMQALYALSFCADANLVTAVAQGFYDPSEMIRRQSAHLAGKIGDPSLIKGLKDSKTNYNEVQRVAYAAQTALQCFGTNGKIDPASEKVSDDIRRLRNYPSHFQVDHLLTILNDQSVDTDIRLLLCEALGWYNYSIHREKLINALEVSLQNDTHPLELRAEMIKTLKRLKYI